MFQAKRNIVLRCFHKVSRFCRQLNKKRTSQNIHVMRTPRNGVNLFLRIALLPRGFGILAIAEYQKTRFVKISSAIQKLIMGEHKGTKWWSHRPTCIYFFQNKYAIKKFWEELSTFLYYDTVLIENDASNNSSIVACVFLATVTFLPSLRLVTTGGYWCTHKHRWYGSMKSAVEMSSVAMIYISNFITIGSGIQKLSGGRGYTHKQHDDLISLLSFFFQNTGKWASCR
jgi:hypothetical protein